LSLGGHVVFENSTADKRENDNDHGQEVEPHRAINESLNLVDESQDPHCNRPVLDVPAVILYKKVGRGCLKDVTVRQRRRREGGNIASSCVSHKSGKAVKESTLPTNMNNDGKYEHHCNSSVTKTDKGSDYWHAELFGVVNCKLCHDETLSDKLFSHNVEHHGAAYAAYENVEYGGLNN
jgi:hypothetical protein